MSIVFLKYYILDTIWICWSRSFPNGFQNCIFSLKGKKIQHFSPKEVEHIYWLTKHKHKGGRDRSKHIVHYIAKQNSTLKIISATKQNYKNLAIPQNSEKHREKNIILQHREKNIIQNTIRMQRSLEQFQTLKINKMHK